MAVGVEGCEGECFEGLAGVEVRACFALAVDGEVGVVEADDVAPVAGLEEECRGYLAVPQRPPRCPHTEVVDSS